METAVIKDIVPDSVIPFPDGFLNRVKYFFWRTITPGYLFGQNTLLALGIIHHEGRQNFVVGKMAPGVKIEDFIRYLHSQGFWNHFIAWNDDGQVVGLRKLESFERQYHLRIFNDGEVRGHYEYTPESHPRRHSKEVGFEERRDDFLRFVGDWVVPSE
jgi:hypothetical protein